MIKIFTARKTFNSTLFLALFAILSACSSAPEDAENGAAPEGAETAQTTPATDAVPGDATADAAQTPEAKAATDATAAAQPTTNDPSLDAQATTTPDTTVAAAQPAPSDTTTPAATQPAPITNEDLAKAEVPTPPAAEASAPPASTETASTETPSTPEASVAITDTPAATETGDSQTYKVKSGDTLMKIAFEQYGDLYHWREIYSSNQGVIQDPNHVPPGTVLQLGSIGGGRKPGSVKIDHNGEEYMIKAGDTLGTISDDVYGTNQKWKILWENNRQLIKDPNRIYAGFFLYYVPDQEKTASN